MRVPIAFFWLFLAATLCAGSFDYPDFSSPRDLSLVGSARSAGTAIRLTEALINTSGGFWHVAKQPVGKGFETVFRFRLTGQGGLGSGADGLAFVLQNSGPSALAGRGSAGGWGLGDGERNRRSLGIPRAIAVFFDTFRNAEDHDPSDNYVEICTNGNAREMKWPPHRLAFSPRLTTYLKDGEIHTARLLYQPPVMSVFLDGGPKPVLVSTIDLRLVADPQGNSWIGFTGSTGSGYENHDVLSWSFTSTDVSSAMVSSNISFYMENCLPGHNLCTPDRPVSEEVRPGVFHIVLPANLKWGASIPNPSGREISLENARGTVCWDVGQYGADGCSGPDGNTRLPGGLKRDQPAGALIHRTQGGRTYFSVNDRQFHDNEGYFEFEAELR